MLAQVSLNKGSVGIDIYEIVLCWKRYTSSMQSLLQGGYIPPCVFYHIPGIYVNEPYVYSGEGCIQVAHR